MCYFQFDIIDCDFFCYSPETAPSSVDMFSGPFDDTQFDAVVDVETCDDGIDLTGTY